MVKPTDDTKLWGPPMVNIPDNIDPVDDAIGKLHTSHDVGELTLTESELSRLELIVLSRDRTPDDITWVEKLWSKYNSPIVVSST